MKKYLVLSIFCLFLAGCAKSTPYPTLALPNPESSTPRQFPTLDPAYLSPINSPTPEAEEPQKTTIPSLTATEVETQTPTITATPTSIPEPSCNYQDLLQQARFNLAGMESRIFLNATNGQRNLYLWFVSDLLNEDDMDLTAYKSAILEEALIRSTNLYLSKPECIAADFEYINTIVVDQSYNILLIGKIKPEFLPNREITAEDDLNAFKSLYEASFVLSEMPEPLAEMEEGCSFASFSANVQSSLGIDNLNQGMYYFVSADGYGTILTQWEGEYTFDDISGKLVNIIFESSCFQLPINQIVINVIDSDTTVIFVGVIESSDGNFLITDLQTIYP